MDIKDAALKYLAHRPRTCAEMKKHLQTKDYEDAEIQEALEMLKEFRYLDDPDYCCQYISYACGKGRGFLRIRRELEEKGVDREAIEIAFADCEPEESELERAARQAAKIAQGEQVNEKLLGRIGRRLTGLGYSTDVVYEIIGRYMRKDGIGEKDD